MDGGERRKGPSINDGSAWRKGGLNRNEKLGEYDKVGWDTRNFAGDFHESSK